MSIQEFVLFLISVVAGVVGQFFLKSGALKLGQLTASNAISHVIGIATTPELVIGLCFYAGAAVLYILLLTRVPLSILAPSVALQYVFSVMLGRFVFNEPIPIVRLVGVALIICGVVLLMAKK
ncbi:EamA family transporter [Leptolyngbya sp. NIES-2104]|uniref:EamA family transporter n=1 Tax=Leptolyngbya sp. NIES-2104 TaxID=1552121 RepID=UPI0006EC59B5|nr:EamA family transporter [Leptolyngbya sp. NIES-2104]GAP96409.1 permease of the drug/metabolite transporter (DMT) superfamily [Leptolyngbya sp. NIES-2104]